MLIQNALNSTDEIHYDLKFAKKISGFLKNSFFSRHLVCERQMQNEP